MTDQQFRRRGATTSIVRWGVEAGDREGVFCGVEASVMGAPLYRALGFEKLVTWVVQVPGDMSRLVYDVMNREPNGRMAERQRVGDMLQKKVCGARTMR